LNESLKTSPLFGVQQSIKQKKKAKARHCASHKECENEKEMKSVGLTASQKQNSHRKEIAKKGKILRSKGRLKEWVKEPAKQGAKEVCNWEKSRNGKPLQRGSSSAREHEGPNPSAFCEQRQETKAIDRELRSAPFRTDEVRAR
jgi:hypothetical protein